MRYYLVGFMGSGKTHWGSRWAEKHVLRFVDTDHEVEAREEMSVAAIFEQKGESFFRKRETEILRSVTAENCLVACGGGLPCYHDNMNWMNKHGITIYLSAPAGFLANNILKDSGNRPLINGLPSAGLEEFINQKLAERKDIYQRAKFTLDATGIDITSLSKIINGLKK